MPLTPITGLDGLCYECSQLEVTVRLGLCLVVYSAISTLMAISLLAQFRIKFL